MTWDLPCVDFEGDCRIRLDGIETFLGEYEKVK